MRALRPVVALAALALGAAACSGDSTRALPRPSKAFCVAAFKYDDRLPKLVGKIRKQIALVEPIAANAPKDVKRDAELFLDALRRLEAGDKSVVDNAKVKRAIENVDRRAARGCDFYKQEPGSGI
jgi:hypothetical protein